MGILLDKGKGRLAFTISIISTVLYWGSIAIFGIASPVLLTALTCLTFL